MYNNGRTHAVRVYMDINYGDEDKCVARGDYYDTLMDDNDYSSHQWVTAC